MSTVEQGSEEQHPLLRELGPDWVQREPDLIRAYFKFYRHTQTEVVCTDKFLDKSKAQYNSAWLMRELIQNFVDHNPEAPGTLDGVRFQFIKETDGKHWMMTIEGDWPFKDSSGITHADSDKPEGLETAGGNGIGLKQAAIRLLRDFGVDQFMIHGEGWRVDYGMVKSGDINNDIIERSRPQSVPPTLKVKKDWLLAFLTKIKSKGITRYTIRTDNPELAKALEGMQELGVSKENSYLKNPDFKNSNGAIKWSPYTAATPPLGRLFINGQVMNYHENGKTASAFWTGPQFLTLQLNNIPYDRNIDRPPVTESKLSYYVDGLVGSMSKQELVDQLLQSEHLWSRILDNPYSSDRMGCSVLIKKIVDRLATSYDKSLFLTPGEYQQNFGSKQYLAYDSSLTPSQAEELRKQGFTLCSSYFEKIGMPNAKTKLNLVDSASNEMPKSIELRIAMERMAKEMGIQSSFEDCSQCATPRQLFEELFGRTAKERVSFEERPGRPGTFRLTLNVEWPEGLLKKELRKPKTEEEKFLSFIRGVCFEGLQKQWFTKAFTSQGKYLSNFLADRRFGMGDDLLLVKNVDCPVDGGVFLEFETSAEAAAQLSEVLGRSPAAAPPANLPIVSQATPEQVTRAIASEIPVPSDELAEVEDHVDKTPEPSPRAVRDVPEVFPSPPAFVAAKAEKGWNFKRWATVFAPVAVAYVFSYLPGFEQKIERVKHNIPGIQSVFDTLRSIPTVAPTPEAKAASTRSATNNPAQAAVEESIKKVEEAISTLPVQPTPANNDAVQLAAAKGAYGGLKKPSGYLTGKTLADILDENNTDDIQPNQKGLNSAQKMMQRLNAKLEAIQNRMGAPSDEIEDFQIELHPQARHLKGLDILRTYVQITTGAEVANDLFVFDGRGARGVNMGKRAIGIHRSTFNVSLFDAMSTFLHEVAHNGNDASGHDENFAQYFTALIARQAEAQYALVQKVRSAKKLTKQEKTLLTLQQEWDRLRTNE